MSVHRAEFFPTLAVVLFLSVPTLDVCVLAASDERINEASQAEPPRKVRSDYVFYAPTESSFITEAAMWLKRRQPSYAVILLTQELGRHPRNTEALLLRAKCYCALKQNEAAVSDVKQVLRIKPDDRTASLLLLSIPRTAADYARLGIGGERWAGSPADFREAVANLSEAIRLTNHPDWRKRDYYYPEIALIYAARARAFGQLEEYERAASECSIVINHFPGDTGTLMNRASNYLRLRRFDLALKDYDRCIEMQGEPASLGRAIALIGLNQQKKALHELQALAQQKSISDEPMVLFITASAMSVDCDMKGALSALQDALAIWREKNCFQDIQQARAAMAIVRSSKPFYATYLYSHYPVSQQCPF